MTQRAKLFYDLCVFGVCINTFMFPISLLIGREQLALFQLLSALGCWVGVLNNTKEE